LELVLRRVRIFQLDLWRDFQRDELLKPKKRLLGKSANFDLRRPPPAQ